MGSLILAGFNLPLHSYGCLCIIWKSFAYLIIFCLPINTFAYYVLPSYYLIVYFWILLSNFANFCILLKLVSIFYIHLFTWLWFCIFLSILLYSNIHRFFWKVVKLWHTFGDFGILFHTLAFGEKCQIQDYYRMDTRRFLSVSGSVVNHLIWMIFSLTPTLYCL